MQKTASLILIALFISSTAVLAQSTQKVTKIELTSTSRNGSQVLSTSQTTIYIAPDGTTRTESSLLKAVLISNDSKALYYTLQPGSKTVLKVEGHNADAAERDQLVRNSANMGVQKTSLGTETIFGFTCQGYATSVSGSSTVMKMWQCTDPATGAKFSGRTESSTGAVVSERSITRVTRDVEVPATLFEIPKDWTVRTINVPK
jgi:hypothetical protein